MLANEKSRLMGDRKKDLVLLLVIGFTIILTPFRAIVSTSAHRQTTTYRTALFNEAVFSYLILLFSAKQLYAPKFY